MKQHSPQATTWVPARDVEDNPPATKWVPARDVQDNPQATIWVPARDVRARYGNISQMTIWRWLRDPNLGFPQPRFINKRRYWLEQQLDAFDARAEASTPEAQ